MIKSSCMFPWHMRGIAAEEDMAGRSVLLCGFQASNSENLIIFLKIHI